MTVLVQAAPSGARGIDTITPFSPQLAASFKAAGYQFIVRYLGAIDVRERDAILGAGLGLLVVGYSRRAGWEPSAAIGEADGQAAVQHAGKAELMAGMSIYCDMEGPAGSTTAADCIGYVNAWAKPVIDAGYRAGIYVGYGIPLTPRQLYQDLIVTGYWHSVSRVQDVAVRGYQMIQQPPGNRLELGIKVDVDQIDADRNGDTPYWMVDLPDSAIAQATAASVGRAT
jgi:hypothetical protein